MSGIQIKDRSNGAAEKKIVNDFSMTVATVNGSGSQTSNLTLQRALFKMGIPVSGKNLFPSNIQGLPTWYTIRINKNGYTARSETHQIVVAMNPATIADDLQSVEAGGAFYYADHIRLEVERDDISIYAIPAKEMAKNSDASPQLRDYVANMVYVGVLAQMLNIQMDKIRMALDFHFSGKEKPVALNMNVIEAAAKWAAENLEKTDPFYVEELNMTEGCVMSDGNTAGALGSIFGGVQYCSWYPITPASTVAESLVYHIPHLRDDLSKDGGKTYAVVQAEDELAAIGMAVGAGWAGLRSMTSTSGPGLSLMSEFVGLAYYSEIPVVIWDIQRVGPSTGLPTRTSQGDLTMVNFLGHGDTQHIILLPGTVAECFEFGWKSFDIAERVQTPVFVLSDLDLGMNHWMSEEFKYPETDMDRGKVLWEEDFANFQEKYNARWGRYLDVDGDGIAYRTLPGNKEKGSGYFARGTGHDEYAAYTEDNQDWEENMERLVKKFETAKTFTPKPVITGDGQADVGIIAFGSTEPAVLETMDYLKEKGIAVDFLRLRSLPIHEEVGAFIEDKRVVYIVELNRDGQLFKILNMELPTNCGRMVALSKHDGLPLSATWLMNAILEKENK
ncbi:MAG TPA: 2-oxoacid:acceptor oxidoreductase subunit alpha [Chloroflexi bacterium]|nr:2-oxoacid:acceptor oxidoreductase subunit alpha [Chloroflexota bacterium]